VTTPAHDRFPVAYGRPAVSVSPGTGLLAGNAGGGSGVLLAAATSRPEDVVAAVFSAVGSQLPASVRTGAPVLLVASRLAERQAEVFFEQCRDVDQQLRPLGSVRMEASLAFQRFADQTGWTGSGYAVVTPWPQAVDSAVRWATSCVATGALPAAYVCEVLPYGPKQTELIAAGVVVAPAEPSDAANSGEPGESDEPDEPAEPAELSRLDPRPRLLDVLADPTWFPPAMRAYRVRRIRPPHRPEPVYSGSAM
jgi:hypothetical protein